MWFGKGIQVSFGNKWLRNSRCKFVSKTCRKRITGLEIFKWVSARLQAKENAEEYDESALRRVSNHHILPPPSRSDVCPSLPLPVIAIEKKSEVPRPKSPGRGGEGVVSGGGLNSAAKNGVSDHRVE